MLKQATILSAAVATSLLAAGGMVHLVPAATPTLRSAPSLAAGPADDAPTAPRAAQVSKSGDGHYWAQAEVDGRWVRLLVDTGASTVALTRADAARLGLDVDRLDYAHRVATAGGETKAAQVTLGHVSVAGARIDGVEALVVPTGLKTSLLGMSYLGRLSRFEATRSALILRP